MVLISDSLLVEGLLLLCTLLVLVYYYISSKYDYWKKRGIPFVQPEFLFGNLKDQILLRKHATEVTQDIYNKLAGERLGGYYEGISPMLMIRDPELIEKVLIKDFSYFTDRYFEANLELDPLSGSLFTLKGNVWKNLRNKLTPVFTTGKLRGMLEQISNCGNEVLAEIEKTLFEFKPLDAKRLGSNFTTDVIASCAFGLQFKTDSPEGKRFREMTEPFFNPSPTRFLQFMLLFIFSTAAKILRIRQVPKPLSDYIIDLVKTTMRYRTENKIKRNDFMQMMMELKEQENSGKSFNWKTDFSDDDAYLQQIDYSTKEPQDFGVKLMSDECIAAQAFIFLAAGSETVALSVSFLLFELATNLEVQERVQQEVDSVLRRSNGKLTYDGLKTMVYIDMVIQEANRKLSAGGGLIRQCNAPYKIPGSDTVIEKGTRVMIPIRAIHYDPEYYPDPDKFIPERFEGNNYHSSGRYLPFGDGPRICIAMRFVVYELKVCLVKIMSKYSVTLDSKTKVPIQLDPTTFQLNPVGGIWVRFHKRTDVP